MPFGLTVPAPPTPRPLPAVVGVVVGAVALVVLVVVVDGLVAVVDVALLEPGMVVLTSEGSVVEDPETVDVVVSTEAPAAVVVVDSEGNVVLEAWVDALVLLPRSPGWTIAITVPATNSRPDAPRSSFSLVFRVYLGRSVGWGALVGAGDGNRTRTTSLEGWGSSR